MINMVHTFDNKEFTITITNYSREVRVTTHRVNEGFYYSSGEPGVLHFSIGSDLSTTLGVNFATFGMKENIETVMSKSCFKDNYTFDDIMKFLKKAEDYVKSDIYKSDKRINRLENGDSVLRDKIKDLELKLSEVNNLIEKISVCSNPIKGSNPIGNVESIEKHKNGLLVTLYIDNN